MSRSTNELNARDMPLESLILPAKVRRALIRAGFQTLGEALDLSYFDLSERVGSDVADDVYDAWDRGVSVRQAGAQKTEVQSFGRRTSVPFGAQKQGHPTSRKPSPQSHANTVNGLLANTQQASALQVKARDHRQKRFYQGGRGHLPACTEATQLKAFERKASLALGVVSDHAEDAFMGEALGTLSADIPMLRRNVIAIFKRARSESDFNSSLRAVRGLANDVPDSFLLYMLDSAQRNFTGTSVWRASFAELGITDNASEQEIPRFLYDRILSRGFRAYGEEETGFQYYYTILLHAGLAESDWVSIWSRLILPIAKDIRRGKLPNGSYPTADDLAHYAADKYSGYYIANRSAINLITKAPDVSYPLLEGALSVADTLVAASLGKNDTVMMSSNTLPNRAMEALRDVLDAEAGTSHHARRNKTSSRIIYFPSAQLRLNTRDPLAPVQIHWDSTRFPREFAGRRVTYRVNGTEMHSCKILTGVDAAVLEEVALSLAPARAYDVEIELSGSDKAVPGKMFATQTFRANRPGVYEFVRSSDGALRQKQRQLKKTKEVKYLTAPDYRILPKAGMTHVNTERLPEGFAIHTYTVEPLGCGEVIDPSGHQVSAWSEGFKVSVDRSQVIGEGHSGSDLYPCFISDVDAFNSALPSITVESLVDGFGHEQLQVECLCDNRFISIKRSESLKYGSNGQKVVVFRIDQSMIPEWVSNGKLRIVHKPTGTSILSYRFSVIAIQRVALQSAEMDADGACKATYSIYGHQICKMQRLGKTALIQKNKPCLVQVPLADEWLSATFMPTNARGGQSVEAHVFLAGIDVTAPKIVKQYSAESIDRHDLQEMVDADAVIGITCAGRRKNRGIYLSLGNKPSFYKQLPVTSNYSVNPFSPLPYAGTNDGWRGSVLALSISYECGYRTEQEQANCLLDLGSVKLGYGFGKCSLEATAEGPKIRFEQPLDYDLKAHFSCVRNGREREIAGEVDLPAGTRSFMLPATTRGTVFRGYDLIITFAYEDLFGDADFELGQRVKIKR